MRGTVGSSNNKRLLHSLTAMNWRRERDSNPRYPCGYSGFQDHRHRPLGHPSASRFYCENGALSREAAARRALRLARASRSLTERLYERAQGRSGKMMKRSPNGACRRRGVRRSAAIVQGVRLTVTTGSAQIGPNGDVSSVDTQISTILNTNSFCTNWWPVHADRAEAAELQHQECLFRHPFVTCSST